MNMDKKSILVIGDAMLDVYIVGEVKRISPEAPIPVLKKIGQRSAPGGAANVAMNLAAAGQKTALLSIVGEDEAGKLLKDHLRKREIDTSLMLSDGRPTITKTRFIASNNQQILRVDEEDCRLISGYEIDNILDELSQRIDGYDVVIISDYLKGLLSSRLAVGIISLASQRGVPVLVDPKDPHAEKYRGATLIKPNLSELEGLTGLTVQTEEDVVRAAQLLCKKCECEYVLATLGAKGMLLVDAEGGADFVAATAREVFDVSGAGDTSIAYLSACMANGRSVKDAVRIANVAAGIQVSKAGTSSVCLDEVETELRSLFPVEQSCDKIVTCEKVSSLRDGNDGKVIVFTNGCFDILHIGHLQYLKQAASMGDVLVVGLNSDSSVARLKGPSRPINSAEDRAAMLAALGYVDYVVVFEEDTPYELIQMLQPDILVKGSDYVKDEIVGADIVERYGGKVVTVPLVQGKSSTVIIDRIIQLDNMRSEQQ